jgi:hypothetical protein
MKIPVGYKNIRARKLKIDDVVYVDGRVIDVFHNIGDENWTSPDGKRYRMKTMVYVTSTSNPGEGRIHVIPLFGRVKVLRHATLKGFKKNDVLTVDEPKSIPIFSSKKPIL